MYSCYCDASCSKSPLGIRVTNFLSQLHLARRKQEGKTNLTTWPFSLNISHNCSIRLCTFSGTGKSLFEAEPPFLRLRNPKIWVLPNSPLLMALCQGKNRAYFYLEVLKNNVGGGRVAEVTSEVQPRLRKF